MAKAYRSAVLLVAAAATLIAGAVWAKDAAPQVEVTADAHGAAGAIRAQEDIDAPRQTVWDVLVDCARVGKLMVGVKSCRVLQSDPAGRWDIREQLTHAAVLPSARAVIRTDYDAPHTVAFHRIDGDFKILEGEWRLEPLDGGTRTRLFYQTRVTSPVPAPNLLVRSMLGANMTESLRKLRAASEAAARTQAANSPVKP